MRDNSDGSASMNLDVLSDLRKTLSSMQSTMSLSESAATSRSSPSDFTPLLTQPLNYNDILSRWSPHSDDILVQGNFLFYHYLHDNFNDSGWGCAYRVGQIILSWYGISPVPTILQMQKKLVEIGDKEESFYESCDWIGSFELFLLIDTYCPTSLCKILPYSVTDNIDLYEKFSAHFISGGGPLMIGDVSDGGGAKCIIGVKHTQNPPDTKPFSVLFWDVHYQGPDDYHHILHTSGFGWIDIHQLLLYPKSYNICFPSMISSL